MNDTENNDIGRCSRCGEPADLRYVDGWLCPDCYEDESGVGGHIELRRETAKKSRERLRSVDAETGR